MNNLVNEMLQLVSLACLHMFFYEHGTVVIAGVLQAKETPRS